MERDEEFSRFYCENYGIVHRYVKSMLGESSITEDIVQEAFLEAWKKFDTVENHPNRLGWLLRAACLKIKNLNRKAEERYTVPLEEAIYEFTGEESGYALKEMELFLKSTLSEEEQMRFRRYFLWGYDIDKMSQVEGITKNNIRVRICRLISKLKEKIIVICIMALILGNI